MDVRMMPRNYNLERAPMKRPDGETIIVVEVSFADATSQSVTLRFTEESWLAFVEFAKDPEAAKAAAAARSQIVVPGNGPVRG